MESARFQPFIRKRSSTFLSTMSASSNGTGRRSGRSINFSNSRSFVQKYVSPRYSMFFPRFCHVVIVL